ncbi:hypothetical protein TSOC_010081 [Tetrabaena socialis]|uniref:Ubiquitin-like domain-containing protein n=1 Tax=Tetrabaena socialis TaxID=47790 RepID=A0A2J7ZUA3_9CHLO|nr:hypothetical protein TSOC_010081 [Tetrabaena socialis]|eukprot:PNH03828.1 hypothetical protein TSOC_010081 [Tetrabaena socialis]
MNPTPEPGQWSLSVKHGAQQHAVQLNGSSTVGALQELLQELTGAFVRKQKLIFKGKVLTAEHSLARAGLADGAKLMLLLSSDAAAPTQGQQALQLQKQQRQEDAAQRVKDLYAKAKGMGGAAAAAIQATAAAAPPTSGPSIDWQERKRSWHKTGRPGGQGLLAAERRSQLFERDCARRGAVTGGRMCLEGNQAGVPEPAKPLTPEELALLRAALGAKETDRTYGQVAVDDFDAFVRAGITSFDAADHYGPAEALIGRYLATHPEQRPATQVFTKYCVFSRGEMSGISRESVAKAAYGSRAVLAAAPNATALPRRPKQYTPVDVVTSSRIAGCARSTTSASAARSCMRVKATISCASLSATPYEPPVTSVTRRHTYTSAATPTTETLRAHVAGRGSRGA